MSSQFHSVKYEIDFSAKSILGHIGCTLVSQSTLEVEYESIHHNIWKIKQALTVQSNYVSKESNLFKYTVANKAMFETVDLLLYNYFYWKQLLDHWMDYAIQDFLLA